jgi:hypothetical protein
MNPNLRDPIFPSASLNKDADLSTAEKIMSRA